MMWVRLREPQQATITGLAAYEVYAIVTGSVPTISAHLKRLPIPGRVGVIAGLVGWLIVHLEVVTRGQRAVS